MLLSGRIGGKKTFFFSILSEVSTVILFRYSILNVHYYNLINILFLFTGGIRKNDEKKGL